jgi:hypothetical protein
MVFQIKREPEMLRGYSFAGDWRELSVCSLCLFIHLIIFTHFTHEIRVVFI